MIFLSMRNDYGTIFIHHFSTYRKEPHSATLIFSPFLPCGVYDFHTIIMPDIGGNSMGST